MIPVTTKLVLNKFIVFAIIGGGFGTILFVGLMSGLVGRPNNCIKTLNPETTVQPSFTTTTTRTSTLPSPTTTTSSLSPGQTTTSSSTTTTSQSIVTTPGQTTTTTSAGTTQPGQTTSAGTTQPGQTTSAATTQPGQTTSVGTTQPGQTTSVGTTQPGQTTSVGTTQPGQTTTVPDRTLPPLSTRSTSNAPATTTEPAIIRLPTGLVEPVNYDLLVKAFFQPFISDPSATIEESFEGTVKISFKLNRATNVILLHADPKLTILSSTLTNTGSNAQVSVSLQSLPNQLIQYQSATSIAQGDYLLTIDYKGDFGSLSNLVGFYRSRYLEDGITKSILATDFEPVDARKAFPCFDEPALKATFKIAIEHPSNSIALSNWPQDETPVNIGNNRLRTSFLTTAKMSTYLVCFVVAPNDYDYVEDFTENNVPVRIYARASAKRNNLLNFGLDVAVKVTNFFEKTYFGISDAVPPKIDMIALPNFLYETVENWGLVTYRETALLYSEELNSVSNKQEVALTIAHGLAHFWFGNLVTPSWWNDLWLNEAMALFLEYKSIQAVFDDWDIQDQFTSNTLIPVMYDDGYESSQPVYVEVNNPNEIGNLFSSITYDKGSSVLVMLESTVGETSFRDGLRNYLNTNKFGSGVATDFYKTLTLPQEMTAAGVTAQEYMENWLNQINYPEVDAILNNNADPTVSTINFFQDRFSLSEYNEDFFPPVISPFNYIWKIYLQCYAGGIGNDLFADVRTFNFYLDKKSDSLKLDKKYEWIKCNRDFKGFYVTSYSKANFDNLVKALQTNPKAFTIGDRADILHGTFSLAYKGTKTYFDFTEVASYLELNEQDYVPWRVYFWHINKINQILEHKPVYKDVRAYSLSLLSTVKNSIDIFDDAGSHTQKLLKINLVDFFCRIQDTACLVNTTKLFKTIPEAYFDFPEDNVNSVKPNYRGGVYKYHVQNTNDFSDWFKVNNLYLFTLDPFEKTNTFVALSNTRLTWILDFLLSELISSESQIRAQDFFDIISNIGRNPTGRHQVWAFVREYFYAIVTKFGNSKSFNRAIKNICESFDNVFLLREAQGLFDGTDSGAGELLRRQTIDIIYNNIFWVTREEEIREAFFTPNKRAL